MATCVLMMASQLHAQRESDMQSTTEWAREHGVHARGTVALDNYEPTREHAYVDLWFYVHPTTGTKGCIIDGPLTWKDGSHAIYLLDDGQSVRPYYVAAYHPDEQHVIVHPFPTNVDDDGNVVTRADDGRPVDYSTWMLGPRRAYHVKVA